MIFCLWIVLHAPMLPRTRVYHASYASYPYHVVAPGLPIMWLLSHLTDFCQEIGSQDRNQSVKRS